MLSIVNRAFVKEDWKGKGGDDGATKVEEEEEEEIEGGEKV